MCAELEMQLTAVIIVCEVWRYGTGRDEMGERNEM